nr:DNA-directed RNA polymerase II subunit 1 [Ipomoea batatas]
MDLRFPYSPAEVAKVRLVQFGILSADEIRQMSVVHIEHSETTERGKPKPGGLSDQRLGTIDRKLKCETCMANMAECPGHFGHLELAKPMFHIGFMKTVLSILRCVCFNCSKILADEQNVEGKRIPFGFIERTLPHFTKDDYGPESRGFVENSYLRGLTPQEFFFHAMGGREGLIDTAVKTSETGYIQRRLVKAMEDIMVKYDGTVRNSLGDVIQFLYGEDGMDSVWIESQKLESLKVKKSTFEDMYKYEIDDPNWNPNYMIPDAIDDLRTIREIRSVFDAEVQKLESDRFQLGTEIAINGDNSWPLPVNIQRLVLNAQKTFRIDFRRPSDMHPMEIVEAVDKLQERLKVVHGDDYLSLEAQKNATLFFNILLRSALASKRVLKEYRLTREAFDWVIGEIESRFLQSLVAPGEMIGCVAAQSIGEPATQMTLNTFHYAGVSAKNVTLGVPRLREIINVAKKIKTPSLSVYLKPEVGKTKERAKTVQCALEYTTLRSVTQATEVWYDPDPMSTIIAEDVEFVKSYYEMPDEEIDPDKISPWLLRIELNREMMVDKKLSMADIAEKMFHGGTYPSQALSKMSHYYPKDLCPPCSDQL